MPTYDYKCIECGHTEEVKHPAGAKVYIQCVCGGDKKRMFDKGIVPIYKGPGFYKTDNK